MSFLRNVVGINTPSIRLLKERWNSFGANIHPSPLFVFGNQKSGTSVIANLLAAGSGKSLTLDFAGAKEPAIGKLIAGKTEIGKFVRRNAISFSTDIVKEPSLTFIAPQLMDYFGVERAVIVVRNPFDNIRSILDRLAISGNLQNLEMRKTHLNRTWISILSGTDLNLPHEHYVSTLARRWVRATEIYLDNRERFTPVRYEDFNSNKMAVVANLAQSLDFQMPNDVTDMIDQNFQRRSTNARVPALNFFGPENLERIRAICAPMAERLGYDMPAPNTTATSHNAFSRSSKRAQSSVTAPQISTKISPART